MDYTDREILFKSQCVTLLLFVYVIRSNTATLYKANIRVCTDVVVRGRTRKMKLK
jgi:hypothetical protein